MSPARTDADAQGSVASYDKPLRAAREACVEDFEREYVRRLLQKHNRNVNAVAEAADVDRTYIYRLIRKHGL
jgi:transcriptional regulator of acetoin/glycerol metabolism